MKQKDHKALGLFLLDSAKDQRVWQRTWHRRFFLYGCVGPDYFPLTYFCGFRKGHTMKGHHAEYSQQKIGRSIRRLQERGVRRLRDCFRLGTLMHYLSDSFTYSHTESFFGDMREHRDYEKKLHPCFASFLTAADHDHCRRGERGKETLHEWLFRKRCEYRAEKKGTERDCSYILHACTTLFWGLCEERG
ncbi:MAG: hypothetical protein E7637_04650 [Ruminococcaceae bacterium]|nr:hypothetical protein [Oscillospiraceae bacterium]